jgi:hypothetical protein
MTAIAIYILFTLYAVIEGKREAFYWHVKGLRQVTDLHSTFLFQRFTVWGIVAIIEPLLSLSVACAFPYWHLGAMYYYRNHLNANVYPLGFRDSNSMIGTQRITFFKKIFRTYPRRFAFLILSLFALCLTILT